MVIQSRKDAAAALGISERSLGTWKLQASFPDCSGGHDVDAIRAWRASNVGQKFERQRTDLAEIRRLQKTTLKAVERLANLIESHLARND